MARMPSAVAVKRPGVVSLRNLGWERVSIPVTLDETIGLAEGDGGVVRRMHPRETILGQFGWGETVDIEIEPFRACLVMASAAGIPEIGFDGCEGEIVKDKEGEGAVVKLYGLPGTSSMVRLYAENYAAATCDGETADALLGGAGILSGQHWASPLI